MTRHSLRAQALASVLAAVAGFVDACGFLASHGYFVSFMSGNSTRVGVAWVGDGDSLALGAALLAAFLAGVILAALIGDDSGGGRPAAILALVACALAGSALLGALGRVFPATVLMAWGMGAMNNVFARDGEVSIGVTYMTGSLVKLGQRLAALILGRDRSGWLSYAALWLAFIGGVVAGAASFPRFGFASLWGAAGLIAALAAAFGRHRLS